MAKHAKSRPPPTRSKATVSPSVSRAAPLVSKSRPSAPPPAPALVDAPAATPPTASPSASLVPIVGIGASAGGLEALESFLRQVPKDSGLGYVVVQHLDPTRKGLMVELLQRECEMPVVEVTDRLRVEADHVYVIPPNKDLSVLHGVLHLLEPTSPRGVRLPIDSFFRSLAEDQRERSLGVVLSGMGSDGTLGLRAIKEKAGVAFVQSLASAKFDGMPRSAIDAGLADVVAPVEELAARIIAYRRFASPFTQKPPALEDQSHTEIDKVFLLLRAQTGNDFSLYKKSTLYRRIERRMGIHQIDTLPTYVRYLRENPREVDLLFKELLIGVTSFFRDPQTWTYLKNEVMPGLIANNTNGVLRAWVAGCSTGEEAYSLAIIFREALELADPAHNVTLQIFATDLDHEAVETARLGIYPPNIAADVSPERLRRYFVQDDRGFRVGKSIREMLVFAQQNLIMDPPFTKLDILSCRNLLIYLSSELQRKLMPLFHYSLNPGGVLLLGSAETIGGFYDLFAPIEAKLRIYSRQRVAHAAVEFPTKFARSAPARADAAATEAPTLQKSAKNLQVLADAVLAQRFAPAALLVSERGDVLYTSGRTGKYLEPPAGKANWNVFAMAREGLRFDLSSAFNKALREGGVVKLSNVRVKTDGGPQFIDLAIEKLDEPEGLRGSVMIVITEVAAAPAEKPTKRPTPSAQATAKRVFELEREIDRAHQQVQNVQEEMQTSHEELKSTNEELQSTNEELQSTNEELTTSKEEMQSLNEELQTVNHELQAKVDELSRSNNDMTNLLNSTDIATLFLDGDLNVRRFTSQTAKLIKLIPGDAGRPVTDIATQLDYPRLADDAREVLRSLVFKEKLVSAHQGRWFMVRILPYRTLDNVIDGVVITFTEATASKKLEDALKDQASQLRQMAESVPSIVWVARPDGACEYLNRQWSEYTGTIEAEQLGYGWFAQVHPDEREQVKERWRAALKTGTPLNIEMRLRSKDGQYRWFKTRAAPIHDATGAVTKWYGTHTDIDDVRRVAPADARELSSSGETKAG